MSRERLRRRIIRNLRKMIRISQENIAIVEWWNTHRTEHPPLDCEPDRIVVSLARRTLAAFVAGDRPAEEAAAKELNRYLSDPGYVQDV